jgi:light-regulated signal transduction histidine kinase (bacteriophytochrome)
VDIETFAHLVAHDLKAPLNGIASMVDVVVEDYGARLDDQGRDHLRLIQSMATRSVAMLDALRQYSRISAAPLHLRTIDLGETAPRLRTCNAAARPYWPTRSSSRCCSARSLRTPSRSVAAPSAA